jgi:transposase
MPHIARRGVEDSSKLGRHRWKAERTLAWMNRYRRLTVRYERREDINIDFVTMAADMICLKQIRRSCQALLRNREGGANGEILAGR